MEEKIKDNYETTLIKCVCPNCRTVDDLQILKHKQDIKDYQATILCNKCYQEKLKTDAEIFKMDWYKEKQLRLEYEELLKNNGWFNDKNK